MNVFKCSFCGVFGYEGDDPFSDWGPFMCDCNRGDWELAELETIPNTISDHL